MLREILTDRATWIIAPLLLCCVLIFAAEALRAWRVARQPGYNWAPALKPVTVEDCRVKPIDEVA